MEQKKYNDLQVNEIEIENMRMMKNQLAVQHSKERSEMQNKHNNRNTYVSKTNCKSTNILKTALK